MDDNVKKRDDEPTEAQGVSRRQFISGIGVVGFGAVLGGLFVKGLLLPDETLAIPASGGYLLIDTRKCAGCTSCMLACSLTHHGEENYGLSRIQVVQNPYGSFPKDVQLSQCHQCPFPACVEACPTGANHIDTEHGNVRTVDVRKCIGCERCVQACPFTPSRALWNYEEKHAQKCDLCADTPHWNTQGGPGGKQACVAVCPTKAIAFSPDIPQQSEAGYNEVDLGHTGAAWNYWGFNGGTKAEH